MVLFPGKHQLWEEARSNLSEPIFYGVSSMVEMAAKRRNQAAAEPAPRTFRRSSLTIAGSAVEQKLLDLLVDVPLQGWPDQTIPGPGP